MAGQLEMSSINNLIMSELRQRAPEQILSGPTSHQDFIISTASDTQRLKATRKTELQPQYSD